MQLYGIRIFVSDIDQARRFYGETLALRTNWDYGAAIGFDVGAELIVELVAEEDEDYASLVGRFVGCSLAVEDIDTAYTDLRSRGVDFPEPPERQPWGGVLAHFRDPSGNVLTLLGS